MLLLAFAAVTAAAPDLRATELIGMSVVDPAGRRLGPIQDLIFDATDARLRLVTVHIGGREAGFHPGRFELRDGRAVLNATEAKLERVPDFGEPKWPAMRASTLIRKEVRDRLHRDAGEVVDLLVDLDERRVHHALMDLRDDWKAGAKLTRVPIEEFSLPRDLGRHAILNMVLKPR